MNARAKKPEHTPGSTIDAEEVARFAALADEWWNPDGPYRPLHGMNPVRLTYIRDRATEHFGRDARSLKSLEGLSALDVGCGGGLLSEPLARLGASVTGIEPAGESVEIARAHAAQSDLAITYRAVSTEELVAEAAQFDLVIASEVIEHVTDPAAFVASLAALTRPGGLVLISTLNRTLRALAFAKFAAEYILRWVPAGTHDWERFVTPVELKSHVRAAGLRAQGTAGMIYNPVEKTWRLGADTAINYWLCAAKPDARGK